MNGSVVGRIHSTYVDRRNNLCEIGYCIGYEYWNKGIVTEALLRVLGYLLNTVKMHRVYAMHDIENPASGKVMQKCGMKYEGNLRGHFLRHDNTYSDGLIYGILSDEFSPEE